MCGDWKLIEFFEDGKLELYNIRQDISEQHDLAGQQPERMNELHAKLKKWQYEIEAEFPKQNPDYEARRKRPKVQNNAHV